MTRSARSDPSNAAGYTVVAACFVALLVGPLSIGIQTVGMFVKPVSAAFGWHRAAFFLGPSVGAVIGALTTPFVGAAADRWGVRRVLAVGVVFYGGAFAALGAMTGALPLYLGLCCLAAIAGQVQSPPLYSKIVAGWFDRRRGLMISLALCGLGVGGIFVPPLARFVMDHFGWRWTYAALGGLIVMVALPPILLLVRERAATDPEPISGHTPMADPSSLSLAQAARTRPYWTLVGFYAFASFAMTGIVSNLVPMLVEGHVSMRVAVGAMSVLALSQTLGRICSGYLLDRFPRPQISLVWFIGSTMGLVALLVARSPTTAVFAAAMLGLAWGAEGETSGYYVSRYFGVRYLATIAGSLFAAIALAAAASQMVTASLYDRFGGYQQALGVAIGAMVLGCLLLVSLGRYVFMPAPPDLDVARAATGDGRNRTR
jgi:MFS family permease